MIILSPSSPAHSVVQNLEYLLSLSPINQRIHQTILHSLMALSLEHTTHALPPSTPAVPSPHIRTKPPTQSTLDSHLHTVRSTPTNVANRIFDKPFTLIVDPSTRAGATGEHSPCDALVPSIVAEYGIVEGIDLDAFGSTPSSATPAWMDATTCDTVEGWERLDWVVDDRIRKECIAAQERAAKIINDSDDSVLWFEGYGSDWIKGVGMSESSIFFSPTHRSHLSKTGTRRLRPNGPSTRMV